MRNKTKIKEGIFIGAVIILLGWIIVTGVYQLVDFIGEKTAQAAHYTQYPGVMYQIAEITVSPRYEALRAKTPTMREWVLQAVKIAGLDTEEVDKIIQCESGWDNWKYGINTDGSTDFGLLQINSVHKKTISVECRWDYKCATMWAIQKRLNDGDWCAWVCAKC